MQVFIIIFLNIILHANGDLIYIDVDCEIPYSQSYNGGGGGGGGNSIIAGIDSIMIYIELPGEKK